MCLHPVVEPTFILLVLNQFSTAAGLDSAGTWTADSLVIICSTRV